MLKVLILLASLTAGDRPCLTHDAVLKVFNDTLAQHHIASEYLDIPAASAKIIVKAMVINGTKLHPTQGMILIKGSRDLGPPVILNKVKGCYSEMAPLDANDMLLIQRELTKAHVDPTAFKGGRIGGNEPHDKDGEI
jgi:hypothetical protein